MFNGTILQQGRFTSTGVDKTLKIRSDVDWMEVFNYTHYITTTDATAVRFNWQYGMGSIGLIEFHDGATSALSGKATASGAFTLINSSDPSTYEGAWTAVTGGSNITAPVFTTADTTGVSNGSIVRIKGTDQTDLNGVDFSVDTVTLNTSFKLTGPLATAPGVVAGASGYYKLVSPNLETYKLFTPSKKKICNITAANPAVVTTIVDHGYRIGEKIRFSVNSDFGMTQMNNLVGTIASKTDNTFTTDIDASTFTAFKFPTAAEATATVLTYAMVTSIGMDESSTYANETYDALRNQGYIGMVLATGKLLPAGITDDVIYWRAGKSYSKLNLSGVPE